MARVSPGGARSPGGDPFALAPALPPIPAIPTSVRYDPHHFGRITSLGAAIRAVGHSVAHVGGSATPGANPSPGPPAVHEAAPIRGFKLPKSLSIACNAVGSMVQISGLTFSPRAGWSSPCGLSPALVPAPCDSFAIRHIPYVPLGPPVRRAKRGQHGPGRVPGDSIPAIGELTFESAMRSGTSFALNPDAFVRRRRRMTDAEKASLVTHDDVLEYKREGAADWLVACVPADLRDLMLGGDRAISQCPDPTERESALRELFMSRAGPDGSACGKVRRFLEALYEASPADHLPASRLLVNRVIVREGVRALTAAKGSQGGATVAGSMRAGAIAAYNMGFPIEAANLLVDAAAPPAKKRTRERRAGSIPIKWYAAFDHWSRALPPGHLRIWVRSLLIAWLSSRLRLVDVLRSYIRHGGYAPDGSLIIQVIAKFSKDGHPIDIYIRAGGPLGDWEWAEEHIQLVQNWKYCLPAFDAPGHSGDVTHATQLLPRVVSRQHALSSLIAITSMAPLGATKEVWAELGISGHSAHGSASDMATVVGIHAPPDIAMGEADERELGHWRRLARQDKDGELELEPELHEAVQHAQRQHAGPGDTRPAPAPATGLVFEAEDAEMRVRYSSGSNREGRRRAQLRVHLRWITALRRALTVFGRPWDQLPGDRSEYDLLEELPPAA